MTLLPMGEELFTGKITSSKAGSQVTARGAQRVRLGENRPLAFLTGGAVRRGEFVKSMNVPDYGNPVMVFPATGAIANTVTSTLKPGPRLAAAISKTGRSVDRGILRIHLDAPSSK